MAESISIQLSGNDVIVIVDDTGTIIPVAPTIQASMLIVSNNADGLASIGWTNGNGTNRIVVVYPSAVYTNPSDGSTYTASTVYGSGSALGLGYVVYSGTGSSVSITGLSISTTYYVKVYEANTTLYNTSTATDNPKSFVEGVTMPYTTSSFAILAGAGANPTRGYYSFGGCAIDNTSGRIYSTWRKGAGHNIGVGDADIVVYMTDNEGVTNSAEYILQDKSVRPLYNLTNPSVMVANNRRVIVFWYEQQAGGTSVPKYKYSDNFFNAVSPAAATWSSEQNFPTDGFSYVDGPGEGILLSNGKLLKAVWTNTLGVQTVRCYESTAASNGLSWTFKGNITTDAVNPCDETCIVELPNGNIMAFCRSNTLNVIRTTISTDGGATWAALTNTSITSVGKSPIVVTPSGFLYGTTREPVTGRTKTFWSTDYTTFSTGYIDNRGTQYMYGKPVWSTANNRIVNFHADEAYNSQIYNGPTLIIVSYIQLSQTPLTTVPAYDDLYQSVLDFANANGETLPSTTLQTKHNTFVSSLRTNGKLAKSDGFYLVKNNNATLSAFATRQWGKSWIKALLGDAPTYGVNGFDFDGVNDYFRCNMVLSNQSNFQRDDASITYYTDESGTGTTTIAGGTGDGSFSTRANSVVLWPDLTGLVYANLNNGGLANSVSNGGSSVGLWELVRDNSANFRLYKNGTLLATFTSASSGRAAADMYIGCERYNADNLQFFGVRGFGLIAIGGSKTSWQTEWAAYVASL